jgi:hypothetical protein
MPYCRNSSTPKYARHTIRQEPQVPNADREAAMRGPSDARQGKSGPVLRPELRGRPGSLSEAITGYRKSLGERLLIIDP